MKRSDFVDQARVFIQAGSGGDGHVSFHRARFLPKGGPDGGDGGKGGDVLLQASKDVWTLLDFRFQRRFIAQNGAPGSRKQRSGKDGETAVMVVPCGTTVKDEATGEVIAEVLNDGDTVILDKGGFGGLGNQHFKSSTNQAPRESTLGKKREGRWVVLDLKCLADVGLLGFPNAGKSTLLASLTQAKPKIGNYPFTTLHPNLGVLRSKERDQSLTLADVPGLIEGASEGAGLGLRFLKHLVRTKVILFVLAVDDSSSPADTYQTLIQELLAHDPEFKTKRWLIAVNKTDLLKEDEVNSIRETFPDQDRSKVHFISAQRGDGLDALTQNLYEFFPKPEPEIEQELPIEDEDASDHEA